MDNKMDKQSQSNQPDVENALGANVTKDTDTAAAGEAGASTNMSTEISATDDNLDASAKMDALNAKMMEAHQNIMVSQQKIAEFKAKQAEQIRAQRAKPSKSSRKAGLICLVVALLCFLHNATIAYEVIVPYKNVGGAGDILAYVGFPGYIIGINFLIAGTAATIESKCANFFSITLLVVDAILMVGTPICVLLFWR